MESTPISVSDSKEKNCFLVEYLIQNPKKIGKYNIQFDIPCKKLIGVDQNVFVCFEIIANIENEIKYPKNKGK